MSPTKGPLRAGGRERQVRSGAVVDIGHKVLSNCRESQGQVLRTTRRSVPFLVIAARKIPRSGVFLGSEQLFPRIGRPLWQQFTNSQPANGRVERTAHSGWVRRAIDSLCRQARRLQNVVDRPRDGRSVVDLPPNDTPAGGFEVAIPSPLLSFAWPFAWADILLPLSLPEPSGSISLDASAGIRCESAFRAVLRSDCPLRYLHLPMFVASVLFLCGLLRPFVATYPVALKLEDRSAAASNAQTDIQLAIFLRRSTLLLHPLNKSKDRNNSADVRKN